MMNENNGANPVEVRPISLEDLAPAEGVAQLQTAYGRILRLPFHTLSWAEWSRLGREVPDPKIPKTKLAEDGQTLLPNPDDAHYKEQLEQAGIERQARRLFASLEKAGNHFEGETAMEKWNNLIEQDFQLVQQLLDAVLFQAQIQGRARLENLADSFRPEPVSPSASDHA